MNDEPATTDRQRAPAALAVLAALVGAAVLALIVQFWHPGATGTSGGPVDAVAALTYPVQGLDHCVPAGDPRVRASAGPCQQPAAGSTR